MPEAKQREYALLNEIAQDSMVTQFGLSDKLGIAVGSVNWYIKRLIHRGWVKASHLDRTRLKYDLTSEGMRVFTQRAILYAHDSLKIYRMYREKAKKIVKDLQSKKINRVKIEGDNEVMDILKLTCLEAGLSINADDALVNLKYLGQEFQIVPLKGK
ncbi:MAG: winged helix-turn-helix transcriptional regulator [Anaerolineales bacterium]|nr:winged helix-turn-helix transcriptional regulator [Anaerolineales bacterium]MCZ2122871.1 winged helix-turn-helix domain-containing protein [Anaerolineales bacterium]